MFRYSAFGFTIHSELELPELPLGGDSPDVVIRIGTLPQVEARVTMDEHRAFNTFAGAFRIVKGQQIIVDPLQGGDIAALRTVLTGRLMAFLLRQRGWLPLHASGVVIEGRVVLFLGASGSGKSTTAAAFYAHGYQTVTDDVAPVRVAAGKCLLRPAGSRLRLLDDSRAAFRAKEPDAPEPPAQFQWDKQVFDVTRGKLNTLLAVERIYVLEYGEDFGCERISPVQAVPLLGKNSFARHHQMTRPALEAHLRMCSRVAETVAISRLMRVKSLDTLATLVRYVEGDLGRND